MPTEPAPYAPTIADIERRDAAERKQHAAYIDELRAVAQKARAEGRDRERERVVRILEANVHRDLSRALVAIDAAVRSGEEPGQ